MYQKVDIEELCYINKTEFRQIWEKQKLSIKTDLKHPLWIIATSLKEMFDMSLLYYANIAEYVELFMEEKYLKVVTFCINGDKLESILRQPP